MIQKSSALEIQRGSTVMIQKGFTLEIQKVSTIGIQAHTATAPGCLSICCCKNYQ